jgi:hypothetical protein
MFYCHSGPKKVAKRNSHFRPDQHRVFLLHLSIGPQRDGFRYLLTFITLFSLCLSTCVTQRYHRVRPCWRLAIHCPITQEHYVVQLNAKTTNYSFIDVQEAVGGHPQAGEEVRR